MGVRHKIPLIWSSNVEPATPTSSPGVSMKFDSFPQSVIWLRDRYQAGELELKPPFQRQPVWVAKQKSSLIESILLELPVPEVYIQEDLVEQGGEMKSKY